MFLTDTGQQVIEWESAWISVLRQLSIITGESATAVLRSLSGFS